MEPCGLAPGAVIPGGEVRLNDIEQRERVREAGEAAGIELAGKSTLPAPREVVSHSVRASGQGDP